MSGGHFDYDNFALDRVADDIESAIKNNGVPDEYGYKTEFSKATLSKFKLVANDLRRLSKQVLHIDWLLSGDDGEEQYLNRIKEEKHIKRIIRDNAKF